MSKEYPVEMTHTTDFENYAEGFVDGGMGASRLVRQSYEAEISRLKEELEEARASASAVRKAVLEEAMHKTIALETPFWDDMQPDERAANEGWNETLANILSALQHLMEEAE